MGLLEYNDSLAREPRKADPGHDLIQRRGWPGWLESGDSPASERLQED